MQEQVRKGEFTDELMKRINSRVGAAFPTPADGEDLNNDEFSPTVAVRNRTIKRLYDAHSAITSDKLAAAGQARPILLLAQVQSATPTKKDYSDQKKKSERYVRRKQPAFLTRKESDYLDTLHDKTFDNIPMASYLYVGAWVLVSCNLGVRRKLANGTRGQVVNWQFPEGTTFELRTYHGVKVRCPVDSFGRPVHVDCVYVKIPGRDLNVTTPYQPANLPADVVCIPRIQHVCANAVPLPPKLVRSNRSSVGVKITQVPLRTAQFLSHYAIQGQQFPTYDIHEMTPRAFYILFSRGKNGLSSLRLREPLTRRFCNDAAPPAATVAEMDRLQRLHEETKIRFEETHETPEA
jgi:hypothetical protein